MSKRAFLFGTMALLAGLAFATPSRAGSTMVTTTVAFTSASPGLTEIDLTYSGAGVLTLTPNPTPVTGGSVLLVGNVAELTFTTSPNTGPFGPISFTMTDSTSTTVSATPTFTPSGVSLTGFSFSVSQSGVPEPASLALLGIGMTGLLAFRRFRKKISVA